LPSRRKRLIGQDGKTPDSNRFEIEFGQGLLRRIELDLRISLDEFARLLEA